MLIHKAFKFQLYPNASQRQALDIQCGHSRFVCNHFLAIRREHYTNTKAGLSSADITGQLAILKRQPDHLWLQEADCL